jgi:hypothetical protein
MKKALVYIAVLTGLFILVSNASGSGTLITDSVTGASGFEKTLQGR